MESAPVVEFVFHQWQWGLLIAHVVSHHLLYLAHLSNIALSRSNRACRRGEVNDFECAHWSDYFGNCWSVGDFSTQPAMVSEKNKRRHQVSPSSESKCDSVSLMPVLCPTMNNLKVVSWTWHIGSLYNILSSTQYSTIWVSWNRKLRSWMLQPIKCIYCFVLVVVFTFDSSLGWQSRMSKRILHSCLTTVPLRHDLGWIINT